jgi:DNA-binding response OmpR family regulator
MLNIILATNRPEALHAFTETLSSDPEVHLKCVNSGTEALEAVSTFSPHLVVIDSYLPDIEPLSLVRKLLRVNAMVNTAVISPLAGEEFHEASEGLGVLGQLSVKPGSSDAAVLLQNLRNVIGAG